MNDINYFNHYIDLATECFNTLFFIYLFSTFLFKVLAISEKLLHQKTYTNQLVKKIKYIIRGLFMHLLLKTMFISLCLTTTTAVLADGCSTSGYQQGDNYFGKTHCQKVVVTQFKVNGPLEINSVQVNKNAEIKGMIEGHDLAVKGSLLIQGKTTLNTVKIAGSTMIDGQTTLSNADLQNLTINGQLNASGSTFANIIVNGNVNLRDVTIKDHLTASSTLVILNGVHVKAILIKKSLFNKMQTVCLEKATQVQGDIQFELGNGKVYTIGNSNISGKVIGGQVIEGECPNQGNVTIQ